MGRYNNPYSKRSYDTYYSKEDETYYTRQPYNKYDDDDDDDDDEGGISWIAVGLCLVFIQPVGFFLLFLKILQIIRRTNAQNAAKKAAKKAKAKQKEPMSTQKLLNIGFYVTIVLAVIFFISGLSGLDSWRFGSGIFRYIIPFVQSALLFVGAFVLKQLSKKMSRRERRWQVYLSIIGNRPYIKLAELAKTTGISVQQCGRDIEDMLEKNMLVSTAYIDVSRQMLVLNPSLVPEEPAAPAVKEAESSYAGILQEFRRLDDDIEDEIISERIRSIEGLTAQIFDEVEKKPDKLPSIRSLLNYYLPTTLKLLHAYANLENQGSEGENINATKQDIERIMDTLVECYKMQLDRLFANEKLDISSDIKVLESMMARDGIGEGQLRPFGSK